MRKEFILRIRIVLLVLVVLFSTIGVRLYYLQVVHAEEYRAQALQQYVRATEDFQNRGAIYFTEHSGKRVAGAHMREGYMLVANPSLIEDATAFCTELNTLVVVDHAMCVESAGKKDDTYEELLHRVSHEDAQVIQEKNIRGAMLFRERWRQYPGGTNASHTLGFVGYGADGRTRTGLYGLERYWESVLARSNNKLYVNFFADLFANVQASFDTDEVREGDIVTSIEPAVQRTLEEILARVETEWHAKQIGGIIMNPVTGDIIALGTLPSYDLNNYADVRDLRVFQNPLIEDVYEMGSIIKPLAVAIGLDEGAITPESTYTDTGSVRIDGYTIRNYDGRARGLVDMQQVLGQSLNVGMAHITKQVGGARMGERMRALGFGEETGIDLPFETHGLITNLTSPREVEYATASFGQGIALTPIATVRALASLSNGGYLVTPHVTQKIAYNNGEEGNVSQNERVQVFREKTSEDITRMLVKVVDESLRNGTVKKERYSIAAKTGTAQMAKEGARGYYDDRYLHSFFGYFPAYEPQFLIFLFHTEPSGAQYASETLTAPFMELVDFLINYYEIPPDR